MYGDLKEFSGFVSPMVYTQYLKNVGVSRIFSRSENTLLLFLYFFRVDDNLEGVFFVNNSVRVADFNLAMSHFCKTSP